MKNLSHPNNLLGERALHGVETFTDGSRHNLWGQAKEPVMILVRIFIPKSVLSRVLIDKLAACGNAVSQRGAQIFSMLDPSY